MNALSNKTLIGVWMSAAIAAMLVSGCRKRPDGVLSDKEMIDLMADMQLAESYSDYEYSGPNLRDYRNGLAESVLLQHGVSREELDSTLSWYGRNLDDYSNLFEKVDKRITEKRKVSLKTDGPDEEVQGDMLWPYTQNGVISNLGNSDGWVVSIPAPGLEKGDMLEWTMHLPLPANLVGVLGVDYEDGTGEAVSSNFSSRMSMDLRLQTDTGKTVDRIYGTMRLKDDLKTAVFVDSIKLRRLPFDSLEFSKYRNQKRYGIPVRFSKKDEKKDSVLADKIVVDSIMRDSHRFGVHGSDRPHMQPAVRPGMSPAVNNATVKRARSVEDVRRSNEQKNGPAKATRQKVRKRQ